MGVLRLHADIRRFTVVFTLELLLRGYFEKPRNIVFDPWNLSAGAAVLLGPKFLPPGAKRVVCSLYTVESIVNIVHNTFYHILFIIPKSEDSSEHHQQTTKVK